MGSMYYRTIDDKKIYYIDNIKIGDHLKIISYLINKGISSSQAHKIVNKVKEYRGVQWKI